MTREIEEATKCLSEVAEGYAPGVGQCRRAKEAIHLLWALKSTVDTERFAAKLTYNKMHAAVAELRKRLADALALNQELLEKLARLEAKWRTPRAIVEGAKVAWPNLNLTILEEAVLRQATGEKVQHLMLDEVRGVDDSENFACSLNEDPVDEPVPETSSASKFLRIGQPVYLRQGTGWFPCNVVGSSQVPAGTGPREYAVRLVSNGRIVERVQRGDLVFSPASAT
jgi:hypothetical protein